MLIKGDTIETSFTSNTRDLDRGFLHAERRAKESASRISSSFDSAFSGVGSIAGGVLGGNLLLSGLSKAASGFTNLADRGIRFNSVVERGHVALTALTRDGNLAGKALDSIGRFADAAGLDLQDSILGAQRLKGFGYELDQLVPTLRDIGDLTASTGDMSRFSNISNAIGQIRSAANLSNEELNQLRDNGVNALGMLSEATGQTVGELRKLAEQGKLSGRAAADIITEAARRRFGGLSETLATTTLEGRQARLGNLTNRRAGEALMPAFTRYSEATGRAADFMAGGGASGFTQSLGAGMETTFKTMEQGLTGLALGDFSSAFGVVSQKVYDAGAGVAAKLEGGIRDGLEMRSPSKVMEGLGFNAGFSFLQGFDRGLAVNTTGGMRRWTDEQVENARKIIKVAQEVGASEKQIQAAFAAAHVESRFRSLPYGDRDSLGIMQQRPSQGWGKPSQVMDVEYAARKFFQAAMGGSQSGTVGQLAQRVQRSAFPRRYDEQFGAARQLLGLVRGGRDGGFSAPGGFNIQGTGDRLMSLDQAAAANQASNDLAKLKAEQQRIDEQFYALRKDVMDKLAWAYSLKTTTPGEHEVNKRMLAKYVSDLEVLNRDQAKFIAEMDAKVLDAQKRLNAAATAPGFASPVARGGFPSVTASLATLDGSGVTFGGAASFVNPLELGLPPGMRGVTPAGVVGFTVAEQKANFDRLKNAGVNTSQQLRGIFQDSFLGMFDDVGQGFKGMAGGFVLDFSRSVLQMQAQALAADLGGALFGKSQGDGWLGKIVGKLFGVAAGVVGGGAGGGLTTSGGVVTDASFLSFKANGGPVYAGRPYVVGEREPELFVPRTSGHIYNGKQVAAMGRTINLTVNFHGQNATPQTRQTQAQFARSLADVLNHELQRGG